MVHYFRIAPDEKLPDISQFAPFRAVIVLNADYSSDWQNETSNWLVRSGCLYMMAWGPKCSGWDDSVDWANIDEFNCRDIPADRFVMTTWHNDETLESVFWFAGGCAFHPTVELRDTLIIHVAHEDREAEFLRLFEEAKTLPDRESD